MGFENVRHILLVLSGKGGVGKSSITTQLALTLSLQGRSVGVLDVDLTGPSMPRFFGIEDARVRQAPGGWLPVVVHEAAAAKGGAAGSSSSSDGGGGTGKRGAVWCMSLGFILSSRSDAVIWRGPKKTAMVRQFLSSVLWPADMDYLLVDTPPGTSDEHISLVETLMQTASRAQLAGALVVTTPQAVSVSDVKKELNFCRKTNLPVIGVLENLAGFVCPRCRECANLFGEGGGRKMAAEFAVPFLGCLPVDPAFVALIEDGIAPSYPPGTIVGGHNVDCPLDVSAYPNDDLLLVQKYARCSLYPLFINILNQVLASVEVPASV